MRQALLASGLAGASAFVVVGTAAALVHRHRHGIGHRYLWGVLVIAMLAALYQYLNYIGR